MQSIHCFSRKRQITAPQAFKRRKTDPVILIARAGILHDYVAQYTTAGRFPGTDAFPSYPWAAGCDMLSKESLW
ncbi:hypothetical protein PS15m_011053 [Mucor circinelloides]